MSDYFSFGSNTSNIGFPTDMTPKICELILESNNSHQKQIDQLIKENLLLRQSIEELIIALKTSTISS